MVQPTDSSVWSVSVRDTETAKEERDVVRIPYQDLVVRVTDVVARIIRGALLASAVLGTLLAGGASRRAF